MSDTHLPGELLVGLVPLQDFPENHGAGEDINLVVVLGMGSPQFRSLPIDSSNKATDHRSCRLLHLGQPEIGDLGGTFCSDQDVGRFTITMDDRRL